MIKEIFISAFKNFQVFLVLWAVIIIANQLFIFGACFAPYCLIAALPHTLVISLLTNHFILLDKSNLQEKSSNKEKLEEFKSVQQKFEIKDENFEEVKIPLCPKCGSSMTLRTAKNGSYSGRNFWGCPKYPKCKGLLNI
jgi:ribosomal protein S27AE